MIVGLGNPGLEYISNRHNVGFMALDFISQKIGAEFTEKDCSSLLARGRSKGENIILAKPQTYMNLSGKAVRSLLNKFSIKVGDFALLHDDVDIEFGEVKDKKGGGAGGHNGISSVIDEVGTRDFRRLRIGVGRPPKGADTADFVLSDFEENEKEVIADSIKKCSQLALNN